MMTRTLAVPVVAALLATPALADEAAAARVAAVLRDAAEADLRARVKGDCDPADLDVVRKAIALLKPDSATVQPQRWIFPVERVEAATSIGGRSGNGYKQAKPGRCYAVHEPGHPAHDLFVPAPGRTWVGRDGKPFHVRAVEEGRVLVVRTGWKPGDPLRGGNYVMLYLPSRHRIAYYAHLDEIAVQPGQTVRAGERLGTVGRTGARAWPARSPTHLHFALWDADKLVPVNPYRLLTGGGR